MTFIHYRGIPPGRRLLVVYPIQYISNRLEALRLKMIKYNARYLSSALGLTAALFLIGGQPGAGEAFQGAWHWIAHIACYAIIAASYSRGIPRASVLLIGGLVAALGGLHEVYEIHSHGHGFEFEDFVVNAMGAFIGSALVRYGRGLGAINRS